MNALRKTKLRHDERQVLFESFAGSGAAGMLAACIVTLNMMGFGRKRLDRFVTELSGFLGREAFGKKADSRQVAEHVRKQFGIDVIKIVDNMEFEAE